MASRKNIIVMSSMLYLVALVFFIWGVVTMQYQIFPSKQIQELHAYLTFQDGPNKPIIDKITLDHQEKSSRYNFSGFKRRDPNFHDTGYLLISRYSKKNSQVIVELFSIANNEVLHTWLPPLNEIFKKSPNFTSESNTEETYRAQHPLLLENGELVFGSGEGPLVQINACGKLNWIINRHFHHSIERDHQGNLVVPIVIEKENSTNAIPMRNDGFAIISLSGEIIKEYSVSDILLKNGYHGLIYGIGKFEHDRLHLNDAQPILKNIEDGKIGDIALSSRNISTVFLLEPQSEEIKWLKTGPWLNQHDVNQLDDGRYSIFGNDITRSDSGNKFVVNDISNIYVFNPKDGNISRPYSLVMSEEQVKSSTEGRSKILANGDAYIEETMGSRLMRISKDTVRWEYINQISPDTVGALHWSRYIPFNEINLKWKKSLTCN